MPETTAPQLDTYRHSLRSVLAASAAPHGYTLAVWTAGAVTADMTGGLPSAQHALLLLVGAATAFGTLGAIGFGGLRSVLIAKSPPAIRVWGAMHYPSVGASILMCWLITPHLPVPYAWLAAGFASTTTYLIVLGAQFWLAGRKLSAPVPGVTHPSPVAGSPRER